MITELMIFAGAGWVGLNIGANDAGYCMGACVGGGALGFRRAMLVAAVFAFVGGLFGGEVTRTISQNVLLPRDLTSTVAATCLLVTGSVVAAATFFGIPVSTSHGIVLGIIGAGLGIGAAIETEGVFTVASAWALLPLVMILLSFLLTVALKSVLSRVGSLAGLEITLKYMLVASGIYASFALGASHAGLAGGLLEGAGIMGRFQATLLGSISIAVGLLLLSGRVIKTVAEGITALSPTSAFAMQLSASIGLNICSILGIPVSSSQSIVAAAVGVGLAQGGTAINTRQVTKIALFWIMIPLGTLVVTYLLMHFVVG